MPLLGIYSSDTKIGGTRIGQQMLGLKSEGRHTDTHRSSAWTDVSSCSGAESMHVGENYCTEVPSEIHVQREALGFLSRRARRGHYPSFLVFADALLEEIGLALQRYQLHPVERVRRPEQFGMAQRGE